MEGEAMIQSISSTVLWSYQPNGYEYLHLNL